jgi:tetratricopeptide (TPR) repeat protein
MDTVVESWDAVQTGMMYAREWLTWAATSIWAAVPGSGVDQKLIIIGKVLGSLAFLYWLWQKWRGTDINTQVDKVDEKVDRLDTKFEKLTVPIAEATEREVALPGSNQRCAAQLEEEVKKGIAAAVTALAKSGKEAALEALKRGETRAADEALAEKIGELEEARGVAGREAADLYRQRGAIAFLHDTQAALRFYVKATELDPDDAEGWNVLGLLQLRAGYLDAAIENFERVLALGNSTADQAIVAAAKDNLGIVYRTRGYLNEAEAMTC